MATLGSIRDAIVEVTVTFLDVEVRAGVRPGRITRSLVEAAQNAEALDALVEQVVELVAWWDITDEAGERLPVNEGTVRQLPIPFIARLVLAAVESVEEQGKARGAASPPAV